MRTKNYAIGIAVALTLPVLSSCGSTETIKLSPPTEYLTPTPQPSLSEEPTNRQVDEYCRKAVERLRSCNNDKQAMKEWSDGQ